MVSYTLITDYKPILNVFIIYKSFPTYWQWERIYSPEAVLNEAVATGGKEGIWLLQKMKSEQCFLMEVK